MKQLTTLLSVAFLISVNFSCNNVDTHTATTPAEKIVIKNQDVIIDYTDTGVGDTTLVFVHGWCINKSYWTDQVAFFKDRYRVVTIDLPGFGNSGKNRTAWTTENYGNDIDSVLSALDLKNVILVGHSMAGDIVLQAAVNDPGRIIGLVGIDNFKTVGQIQTEKDKENFAKAMEQMKRQFTATVIPYFNEQLFYKTTADSIKKRILDDVAKNDSVIAVATIEQGNIDEVKKLVEVKKKLYLINSDVTPTDTTGFTSNNIPYKILDIHATGHYPMIEKPGEFNALLQKVIAGIKSGSK